MGEIADMMIDGEMCACGEFIGDSVGYPRYCSKQCEKDYGGSDEYQMGMKPEVVKTLEERKPVVCPDPGCERRFVNRNAAAQHWVDKHE